MSGKVFTSYQLPLNGSVSLICEQQPLQFSHASVHAILNVQTLQLSISKIIELLEKPLEPGETLTVQILKSHSAATCDMDFRKAFDSVSHVELYCLGKILLEIRFKANLHSVWKLKAPHLMSYLLFQVYHKEAFCAL